MKINWTAKHHRAFEMPTSWQAIPHGERYCNALMRYFSPWTAKILGYQILKIGGLSAEISLNLPLRHQILVVPKFSENLTALLSPTDSLIQAQSMALPFIQQEINACFLMNTLNFAQDPHQILREVDRVLTEDGLLFISLFNPLSPLIFKRKLGKYCFRQYATWRVIDWLELLNFDILAHENLSLKKENATIFSPLTVIVAQKRTIPLTLNGEKVRSEISPFLKTASAFKEIHLE